MNAENHTVYSTFAVPLTGNRGSVSMLVSMMDHLLKNDPKSRVNIFTYYPKSEKNLPQPPNVRVFDGSPANLAFKLVPMCVLHRAARALRIPAPARWWGEEINALAETDVCLWIGGTTFNDSKQYKSPWNVLACLPGILLGKKCMFASQTMGPFRRAFNRWCARYCLSRADVIVPRGQGSLDAVRAMGYAKAEHFADLAFSLEVSEEIRDGIRRKYNGIGNGRKIVGISVNTIVENACIRRNIPHNQIWAGFIEWLQQEGYHVLIIPHSMRIGSRGKHNNDLLTVANIMSMLKTRDNVTVIDDPCGCKELREVVGLADYYVASRFHSMISALCTEKPVLVIGWGYQKYREVMSSFKLEDYCFDASQLSPDLLIAGFRRIVADSEPIKERIRRHLPGVRASSARNAEEALRLGREAIGEGRR